MALSYRSHRLLRQLLQENERLARILEDAGTPDDVTEAMRHWMQTELAQRPVARAYHAGTISGQQALSALSWSDFAVIRLLDYLEHEGRQFPDPGDEVGCVCSYPFRLLWLASRLGRGGATDAFFQDMLQLFRQLSGLDDRIMPTHAQVLAWMDRFPSGLDPRMIELRRENRERILHTLIAAIDRGDIKSGRFQFQPGLSRLQKVERALCWWHDYTFHLRFAIRSPDLLNEMLDFSLDAETVRVLRDAKRAGLPFFVNPYYLSLLNVRTPDFAAGADAAIRQYVIYSRSLVEQFGRIVAWEKEDLVAAGKPNAAGFVLPSHRSIHRRYPEVAILIPDSLGLACGGLCACCQRMYDFQRGNLNFDLKALKPKECWWTRLPALLTYYENDSQLRDILITGGDALMSGDRTLGRILEFVLQMACRKREGNARRPDGHKYAEMVRVRLGSRLPACLPMRVTPKLQTLLAAFKEKASAAGIKQFVIQTHFESPAEVTPLAQQAVERLSAAGWTVTNQLVLTASAARRGHACKLRKVLNDIGVLPYYTFSVKGHRENQEAFATNARAVQEAVEEKAIGAVPPALRRTIRGLPIDTLNMAQNILSVRLAAGLPFLATDRSVMNLPGVGKSLTFRVIGITPNGRRVLAFDHDHTRWHSPIIEKLGKVYIVESRSVASFVHELEQMGEDPHEYASVFGYSLSETEPREPVYEYPRYDFRTTPHLTNLEID
jgi:lysine 2,3-aminomutase